MRVRTVLISLVVAGAVVTPASAASAACTGTGYIPSKNYEDIRFSGSATCSPGTMTQFVLDGQRQGTGYWAQQGQWTWAYNPTVGSTRTKAGLTGCFYSGSTYRSKAVAYSGSTSYTGFSSGRTLYC